MSGILETVEVALKSAFPAQVFVGDQPRYRLARAKHDDVTAIRSWPVLIHRFLVFHSKRLKEKKLRQFGRHGKFFTCHVLIGNRSSNAHDVPEMRQPLDYMSLPAVREILQLKTGALHHLLPQAFERRSMRLKTHRFRMNRLD